MTKHTDRVRRRDDDRAGNESLHAEPQVLRPATGGRPLDSGTRADMEAILGHDFGQVRVHTDPETGDSAVALGARAYTVGSDIMFSPGRYRPDVAAGRRLLAHDSFMSCSRTL